MTAAPDRRSAQVAGSAWPHHATRTACRQARSDDPERGRHAAPAGAPSARLAVSSPAFGAEFPQLGVVQIASVGSATKQGQRATATTHQPETATVAREAQSCLAGGRVPVPPAHERGGRVGRKSLPPAGVVRVRGGR